ncbi:MAG: pyridoxal-dependent decarboxylase [Alphaproteobacteria bacterium]|nr:pyridoxal-dependent decarboxylase [Alphaproteobacteria bacterium]
MAAYDYAVDFRQRTRALDATATAGDLRRTFCLPTPERGLDGAAVIGELISAAEPGLVATTNPNFFAWVMGGSDTTGVAADWLTSIWGQNAGIFQTSPAAAIAEEAVSDWILDLLDLPRNSSVGLVTGATMAGFVGLAAARGEVLARAGHDIAQQGLQAAPLIHIFLGEDAHATNFAALRYLGFGEANFIRIPSDDQGLMQTDRLYDAMAARRGPKIVIATAGHINSGGFDDFVALGQLCRAHDAWLHVDGAFGLWARVLPEKAHLTKALDQADSWSVDGHKWLQIPYDSGFSIVRHETAHRRAMDITADYLNRAPGDGRNPTEFNPELSRRARGFAAWAVIRSLGREGVIETVRRHCHCAAELQNRLAAVPTVAIRNRVDLNQVVLRVDECDHATCMLADRLNAEFSTFVRTTVWHGETVLRISAIEKDTDLTTIAHLADNIQHLAGERTSALGQCRIAPPQR